MRMHAILNCTRQVLNYAVRHVTPALKITDMITKMAFKHHQTLYADHPALNFANSCSTQFICGRVRTVLRLRSYVERIPQKSLLCRMSTYYPMRNC